MAKIDTIFSNIPTKVLSQFGQDITYIKTTTPRTYNPTTGAVTGSDTNVTVKGIISQVNSNENEGVYQTSDLSVLIGAEELGDYYPTQADRIQYTQAGSTVEAKIISIRTYRGDEPVYHSLVVRVQ
mgnify:CR=1 FL=1|tara:strand:+ start:154 stop:531 length:378 start_codon:yes stop_codon:yes gene_type:complete